MRSGTGPARSLAVGVDRISGLKPSSPSPFRRISRITASNMILVKVHDCGAWQGQHCSRAEGQMTRELGLKFRGFAWGRQAPQGLINLQRLSKQSIPRCMTNSCQFAICPFIPRGGLFRVIELHRLFRHKS
jgi:hypothetical protein